MQITQLSATMHCHAKTAVLSLRDVSTWSTILRLSSDSKPMIGAERSEHVYYSPSGWQGPVHRPSNVSQHCCSDTLPACLSHSRRDIACFPRESGYRVGGHPLRPPTTDQQYQPEHPGNCCGAWSSGSSRYQWSSFLPGCS